MTVAVGDATSPSDKANERSVPSLLSRDAFPRALGVFAADAPSYGADGRTVETVCGDQCHTSANTAYGRAPITI